MTPHLPPTRTRLAGALIAMMLAVPAFAQSVDGQAAPADQAQMAEASAASQGPTDQAGARGVQLGHAYWASVGGFEADTHDTGYGFFGPEYVRPFRDNMSYVARASIDYLYYEYQDVDGRNRVRSPGASARVGLRFGHDNWFQVSGGPAFKRRRTELRNDAGTTMFSDSDVQLGADVGADMWYNPTRFSNVHGILTHGTADSYTWGRLAFKEQIANRDWRSKLTPYLGAEYVGQGNGDIRSQQAGAFVEFLHTPSSLSVMLRAGYKRSTFDVGPEATGPYFAVGLYYRVH